MMSVTADDVARLADEAGLGAAAIVLDDLDGPAGRVSLRSDSDLYPASMIKLPIAMVAANLCEARAYAWTDEVTVLPGAMTTNDAPSPFVAGASFELGALVHAMLAASDNVATNVLIDLLDRGTITAACAAFGLSDTAVRRKLSGSLPLIDDPEATGRNRHSPADAATLLGIVAREVAAGRPSRVHDALAAQIWNDKLSRGLDPADRFAHKTGDTDEVSHDGGILTLANGRRFVLVVYTPLPSNPETDARHADFMRRLRPLLGA